jgi:hypothetical protein
MLRIMGRPVMRHYSQQETTRRLKINFNCYDNGKRSNKSIVVRAPANRVDDIFLNPILIVHNYGYDSRSCANVESVEFICEE